MGLISEEGVVRAAHEETRRAAEVARRSEAAGAASFTKGTPVLEAGQTRTRDDGPSHSGRHRVEGVYYTGAGQPRETPLPQAARGGWRDEGALEPYGAAPVSNSSCREGAAASRGRLWLSAGDARDASSTAVHDEAVCSSEGAVPLAEDTFRSSFDPLAAQRRKLAARRRLQEEPEAAEARAHGLGDPGVGLQAVAHASPLHSRSQQTLEQLGRKDALLDSLFEQVTDAARTPYNIARREP